MTTDAVTFAALGVEPRLVEALRLRRITTPFDIQSLVVPDGVAGRDLLGRAPTGSGKTLAFGVPALHRLADLDRARAGRPQALILSPTRELAEQIARELEPLAAAVDRRVLAVYGGVDIRKHLKALRRPVDLLVACPGRLLDLIDQGAVDLREVRIAVVDEADRMADMGFLPSVKRLLDRTAEDRQTLLFSATLDDEVRVLVDRYQRDPAVHEVGEPEPDLSLAEHRFIEVPKAERVWLTADLVHEAGSTVVFVRTRHGADRLARQLRKEGVRAEPLHGGRSQSQRDRALERFVDGSAAALVATDVAARGIHVDGVARVVHYDPPAEHKDYVHRSGRTARAGASGSVVSLLDPPQVKESSKMQRRLGIEADIEPMPERVERDRTPVVVSADRRPARSPGGRSATGTSNGGGDRSGRRRRRSGDDGRRRGEGTGVRSSSSSKPKPGSKPKPKRSQRSATKAGGRQASGRRGAPSGRGRSRSSGSRSR